jgi:hypothetical protein
LVQIPLVVSQFPGLWHSSSAVQITPEQAPTPVTVTFAIWLLPRESTHLTTSVTDPVEPAV